MLRIKFLNFFIKAAGIGRHDLGRDASNEPMEIIRVNINCLSGVALFFIVHCFRKPILFIEDVDQAKLVSVPRLDV